MIDDFRTRSVLYNIVFNLDTEEIQELGDALKEVKDDSQA